MQVFRKSLSYVFGFHLGSIYVFRGDVYDDNNGVKNSLYQESISNPHGVH
jgi:hypothetical protein